MKIAVSFITFWACLISSSNAITCEEENFLGLTTYKTCPGPLDASDMVYCCGTKSNRVCCNQVFGLGEEDLEKLASKVNPNAKYKRAAVNASTEKPIDPMKAVTQEGFRDNVMKIKTKVKEKLNSTLTKNKDKIKTKIKDKVKKKVEEKLDPTGGYMKLPAIIGVLFAVAVGLIILCIICCCCCPFCLLHKKRSRGVVHNPPPGGATYYYSVPHQAQMAPMNAPPSQMYAPVQHGAYPPQPYPPQGYPAQPMVQPQQAQAPYPTSQPPPQPQNDNPPPYAEKQMPYNPNY